MIFGQQSSARTALWPSRPQRLICSSRRAYIPAAVAVSKMSLDILIQQFLSVFLTDSTINPDLGFEVRKETF